MARRSSFSVFVVAMLLLAVAPGRNVANPHEHAHPHQVSSPFTYSGQTGPANWGKLNPNFTVCSTGKHQSPVNINRTQVVLDKNLKPLIRGYKTANATLRINNGGVNVGISYEGNCGAMTIDGKNYTLLQMHWHSPSEHTINGVQYPLELHLVHYLGQKPSVIAVLFEYGKADPFIAKLKKGLKKLAEEVKEGDTEAKVPLGNFGTKLFKKYTRRYYRYIGSFTAPPCTEDVIWNVIAKVRTVSKEQVEELKAPLGQPFKHNCRPLQSLNERRIEIAA